MALASSWSLLATVLISSRRCIIWMRTMAATRTRSFGVVETELVVEGGHIELIHNIAANREPMVPPVLREFLRAAECDVLDNDACEEPADAIDATASTLEVLASRCLLLPGQ